MAYFPDKIYLPLGLMMKTTLRVQLKAMSFVVFPLYTEETLPKPAPALGSSGLHSPS
jgi:hypothetical protein